MRQLKAGVAREGRKRKRSGQGGLAFLNQKEWSPMDIISGLCLESVKVEKSESVLSGLQGDTSASAHQCPLESPTSILSNLQPPTHTHTHTHTHIHTCSQVPRGWRRIILKAAMRSVGIISPSSPGGLNRGIGFNL